MYTIDKNIPIPVETRGGVRTANKRKYPFDEMEVGDSFLVKGTTSSEFSGRLSSAQLRTGYRFTMRKIGPDIRVWRIR